MALVIQNVKCRELDDYTINISEYYDFMSEDNNPQHHPEAATASHPAPQPPKYNWDVVEYGADGVKASWIKIILPILNDRLKIVGVCATADESNSGSLFLRVKPEIGSEEMCDWEKQVKSIIKEYLDNFKELKVPLPKLGSVELLEYAKKKASSNMMTVISDKDSFTIAGECATLDTLMDDICHETITRETKEFHKCHVKFILELCDDRLKDTGVVDYELNKDMGYIAVTTNEKKREYFWSVIDKEIKSIFEKPVTSKCGIFFEILASEPVVYYIEMDPPKIILMCRKKGRLEEIKNVLESMIYFQTITVDPQKFQLCSERAGCETGQGAVTVNESTTSIVVSGERYIVDKVLDTIDKFLLKHTSVEERLKFSSHEWKVKKEDFEKERESIQQSFGKNLSFKIHSNSSKTSIVIRGDPKIVDGVKGKLEAIRAQVCHREVRFPNIPSAIQIIDTLKDKTVVFETSYDASIQVSLTSESQTMQQAGEFETQFKENNCSMTLPLNSHSAAPSSTASSSLPAHVARSIIGSISSHITLTKGDLLQQKVEILCTA